MNCPQVASIALKAGELLLQHSAEIYRVEDTINRICGAYGAVCSAFVLTNGIFISVEMDGELVTLTRSIKPKTTDMTIIAAVNNFSRLCESSHPTYEEAAESLESIINKKRRPEYVMFPARIVCAMAVAVMLGARLFESLSTAGIYVFIYIVSNFFKRMNLLPFLEYLVSGIIAGILGFLISYFTKIDMSLSILCALYPMLPGISITNGIRDLLSGDVFSGLARISEVIILMLILCFGIVLAFTLGGML